MLETKSLLAVGMAILVMTTGIGLMSGAAGSGEVAGVVGHETGYLDDEEAAAVMASGPYVGAAAGAAGGSVVPGAGTAVGAGVGHVVGGATGL